MVVTWPGGETYASLPGNRQPETGKHMGTRSRISLGVIAKNFRRLAQHPWIASKLVSLQGEKLLFNLLYPRRTEGWAHKIRQLSIRITDLCKRRQVGEGISDVRTS